MTLFDHMAGPNMYGDPPLNDQRLDTNDRHNGHSLCN